MTQSSKGWHQTFLGASSGTKALASLSGPGHGRDLPKTRSPSHSHLLKAVEIEEEKKIDIVKCRKVAEKSETGGSEDRNESNWERRLLALPFKLSAPENLLQRLRATVMEPSSILTRILDHARPRQAPWRGSCVTLVVHACI